MNKKAAMPRILAFDHDGRERSIKAAWLEIDFGPGGRFRLLADPSDGGTLVIGAQASESRGARLNLLPLGPDALELRVSAAAPDDEDLDDGVWLDDEVSQNTSEPLAPLLNLNIQKAVQGDDKAASPRKHQIRRWASAALRAGVANVTVRLVGEAEGRALNRDYRGKDYPTNVLSFTYQDDPVGADGEPWCGDLVICVPVVVREAAAQGKTTEAHFAHLVVHGMLHLQGLDHEDAEHAKVMETLETEILATFGFDDPYV